MPQDYTERFGLAIMTRGSRRLIHYARTRPDLISWHAHMIVHCIDCSCRRQRYCAEMFDSSLRAGRYVLENVGLSEYEAHEAEKAFYNMIDTQCASWHRCGIQINPSMKMRPTSRVQKIGARTRVNYAQHPYGRSLDDEGAQKIRKQRVNPLQHLPLQRWPCPSGRPQQPLQYPAPWRHLILRQGAYSFE